MPSVGQSPHRVESRDKVTGRAVYVGDKFLPAMVHATIVRSTIAAGQVGAIDADAAIASSGVLGVFTHLNFPKLKPAAVALQAGGERNRMSGSAGQQHVPLQGPEILYPGQPVAVVVARTLEQSRHAAELVRVRATSTAPHITLEQAREAGELFAPKDIWGSETDHERGDVKRALEQSAVLVDATYHTQIQHHVTIEPHVTVASWSDDQQQLTLFEPSTWVYGIRKTVSSWFGLEPEQIRVVQEHIGGSFGSKGPAWPHVALCVGVAKMLKLPVRLELTRRQTFTSNGHRPRIEHRFALGATGDGRLTALQYDTVAETSRFDDRAAAPTTKTPPRVYACANVKTSYRIARLNRAGPFTFRAPGEAPSLFALESAMDELAYALKLDPLELRLRNYAEEDPDAKQPWSSKSLRACYQHAADRFGWSKRNPQPRVTRDGDDFVGFGMATAIYDARSAPTKATATLDASGLVTIRTATADQGSGSRTALSQMAADAAGVPLEQVRFLLGDTDLPLAPIQAGSQTTASVGAAVTQAGQKLRAQLIDLATRDPRSPLHGLHDDEIDVVDGKLRPRTSNIRPLSYARLLELLNKQTLQADGEAKQINELAGVSRFSFGAHFAEVRVNAYTGSPRVTRWVGAFAGGRIINPRLAHDQLTTGILWGISQALYEVTHVEPRTGRFANEDLAEYFVPTHLDALTSEQMDVTILEEHDDAVNPVGVKGLGELGTIGSAAAVANAIYHATGMRVRDLPITLDKLLND